MTTRQDYILGCSAIEDKHPNAWSIVQHDDNNFSAKVGNVIAYYVIMDNEIVGDIWYE